MIFRKMYLKRFAVLFSNMSGAAATSRFRWLVSVAGQQIDLGWQQLDAGLALGLIKKSTVSPAGGPYLPSGSVWPADSGMRLIGRPDPSIDGTPRLLNDELWVTNTTVPVLPGASLQQELTLRVVRPELVTASVQVDSPFAASAVTASLLAPSLAPGPGERFTREPTIDWQLVG